MVMGTASTMACITEAMGLSLPMSATIPAPHAERFRLAEASGKVAAAMAVAKGPKPSELLTQSSFRNAQIVLQAIGGSTNGLIHLTAIANRTKHRIDLDAFDKLGREVPVLIDLKPSGAHYMEHFHHAGGVPKLMQQLGDLLDLDAKTITGKTLRDVVAGAEEVPGQDAIRSRTSPIKPEGAMAVLHGNLAPRGAVIKHSAASPKLLQHTGRAVVFDSVEDMTLRVDDPDLDVTADDVLVLRNAGPKGAPGMPEAGYLPIPMKLARAGVKDMVRISDARMSGTAFGTIVLHITPESAVGGPLALVKNGDMIRLDVAKRSIDLLVDAAGTGKASRGNEACDNAGLGEARLCASVQRDDPAGRRRLRFRFHARRGEEIASQPDGCAVAVAPVLLHRYFPLLVNFFTASRKSSVCMQPMMASRSASSCCSIGVTWARWISVLVAAMAAGGFCARRRASSLVAAFNSAAGTTLTTSPQSWAWVAEKLSSAR